ncbi:MAG: HAD family hydrolase [Lachnospiraceae bacterium]|nr:HAD family hydrolase [Lachnospiraceae bacterium]
MNKAVFLDRDGTINKEKNYLFEINAFEYLPGAVEGMKILSENGFQIVIITNQSGIARGYYGEEDYLKLETWLQNDLRNRGINLTGVYYCPHLPDAPIKKYAKRCSCRKPETGLFYQAAEELDIDIDSSYAVGDRLRDCEIARTTKCKGILIGHTEENDVINEVEGGKYPNIGYRESLYEAAHLICGDE